MSLIDRVRRQPRRRVGLFAFTAVAVMVTSVVGIQLAGADSGGPAVPVPGDGTHVVTVSGNEKLKNTLITRADANKPASPGITDVHAPITLKCVTRTTCTFTGEGTVQVQNNGDHWAICFIVDASNGGCPTVGVLPKTDGFFTTESISGTVSGLTPGNHTVKTQVFFFLFASTIRNYDLKYRSYNP